jgi:hypothetical protein
LGLLALIANGQNARLLHQDTAGFIKRKVFRSKSPPCGYRDDKPQGTLTDTTFSGATRKSIVQGRDEIVLLRPGLDYILSVAALSLWAENSVH